MRKNNKQINKEGRKIDGRSYAHFENVRTNKSANILNNQLNYNSDSNRNHIKSEIMETNRFNLIRLSNKVNYNKSKNISSTNNPKLICNNKLNLISVRNDSRLFNSKILLICSLFALLLIIFSTSLISAFSVSAPYMENKEWKLFPGASEDLKFVLQNGGATEAANIKVTVNEGGNVLKLPDPDKIYTVPVGERTEVVLKANIPQNATIGETYKIVVGFSTAVPSAQGGFSFGSTIDQPFTIVIGEKPAPSPAETEKKQESPNTELVKTWLPYIIAIAIIIIAVIIFFVIKKKKQSINKK